MGAAALPFKMCVMDRLYNGEGRWTVAEELVELIEVIPGSLERYRPALRYLLPRRAPAVAFPELTDLREVKTMLAERVQEWTREWREQGRKAGRQEGHQKGLLVGGRTVLIRQLEKKFGPLTDYHRQRLQAADAETLLVWSERLLTADTIDDVLQ